MENLKILFVCEYNACRSQMAQGLARALLPKSAVIESAGLYPAELNRLTVEVMQEIGIDISHHHSQQLKAVLAQEYDYLVLLAQPTIEKTSMIRHKTRLLWLFPDPVKEAGEVTVVKNKIRDVRDALKKQITDFFSTTSESQHCS